MRIFGFMNYPAPLVFGRLLTVFCLATCFVACSGDDQSQQAVLDESAIELRVMSFNIEWGGAKISFENVVETIQLAKADIVGIQEAEGNLQRLAGELGWYFDLHNYVISRFPLIAPAGSDGRYVFVEVEPGRIVAVANVHLPSDPYGPYAMRDGASPAEVMAIENAARMPAISKYIDPLKLLISEGIPVFMTGDFNTPSHTDWTAATTGARKGSAYPFEWPVSVALAAAGFSDSWRVVFPDPVTHPGHTWWAARPDLEEYTLTENDPQDRIDFIWFAGASEIISSQLAGEVGGLEVSFGLTPWPSDHRAVVSGFVVVPSELPEFVSSGQRVYRDDSVIDIRSNSRDGPTIVVIRGDNNERVAEYQAPPGRAEWLLPATALGAGHFRLQMEDSRKNGGATSEFWVLAQDAVPVVQVSSPSVRVGESIHVAWTNAPGNRNDYLAAYPRGVETNYDNGLAWVYTKALPDGRMIIDQSTAAWGWPLAPGDYVIRLVKDDGYEVLAQSAPFTVEAAVP